MEKPSSKLLKIRRSPLSFTWRTVRCGYSEPRSTSGATGKVAFIPRYKNVTKKADTIFLTPNKKLSYVFTAEKIEVAPTVAVNDKAWTEGKMIFKAMRLQEIATELE